jgi:hypothetical protein
MGEKEMRSPLVMAAARVEMMMVTVMMVVVKMARVSVGKAVERTAGVDTERAAEAGRTMNEDEETGGTMDVETSREYLCRLGCPVETYVHAHIQT